MPLVSRPMMSKILLPEMSTVTQIEAAEVGDYVTASYVRPQGLYVLWTLNHFGSKGLCYIHLANLMP